MNVRVLGALIIDGTTHGTGNLEEEHPAHVRERSVKAIMPPPLPWHMRGILPTGLKQSRAQRQIPLYPHTTIENFFAGI